MSKTPVTQQRSHRDGATETASQQFVTAIVGGQLCGIAVLKVQDVIRVQRITRIPLAPSEIAGSLNLRGRIVTAIDMRVRLGLPKSTGRSRDMSIVVEHHGELYSLMVDSVGEVLNLSPAAFERTPATIDPLWRSVSEGVYRLEKGLLVVLDVEALLKIGGAKEAA
jgi:purine-binding chemotaxis protein CheW